MSIIQSTAKSGGTAAAGGVYNYLIEQSLRFDGSSYLSRTPTVTGNQKTWVFSLWIKRSTFGAFQGFFSAAIVTGASEEYISFSSASTTDAFAHRNGATGDQYLASEAIYRDLSSWYHFVYVHDSTNATAGDRSILYVNGVRQESAVNVTLNRNSYINGQFAHGIGRFATINLNHFNGYMANIQFIDGQALDASSFGELVSGVWVPKAYTGTYGTNGFHLDFADPNNIGNDVSGNNNHWTVN